MPARIELADGAYEHVRTYKHDFFAATGLYRGPSGPAILKLGRTAGVFGLPMGWLGRLLADHEMAIYSRVDDLPGVPRCLGRYGATGFVHVFVEGHPLQRHEWVNDDFFPRLRSLINALHQRGIAYVDLEKRENILVDEAGAPYLIDFQISWQWPLKPRDRRGWQRLVPQALGLFALRRLQDGDAYHLRKHQRRHRPDTMTQEEVERSYRSGFFIHLHRLVARPLTWLRRRILKWLTGRARSPKQDGPEFIENPLAGTKS